MAMICPLCQIDGAADLAVLQNNPFFSCPECDLRFRHPQHHLDREEERSRYDLHQNSPGDEAYRKFLRPLVSSLDEQLEQPSSGLDFGSGPGPAIPRMFAELGHTVRCYDPFYEPDTEALKQTYDFIACSEAIEHFFDPAIELRTLSYLLKPGGFLGVMTTMFENNETFVASHYHRDPTHVCFYGKQTMRWVADRFDWQVSFPCRNVTIFEKAN